MDEQHDELADKLEEEANAMGNESDKLGGDIDEARSEWESNKQDDSVPGAQAEGDSMVGDDESEDDDG
jgi:hypothetical protein